jgi:hypothetical protein
MSAKGKYTEPPMDRETSFELQNWFKDTFTQITQFRTKAGIPTATDIPPGFFAIYKDTSGGTLKIYANDGGTIKSVTLT